ncbi:hypothetical protein HYPSUDRAFT_200106 [Hypholoma sublateritium FD-334 SS-4]|uniref:DUF6534 domain-containing protein n=1 Tax=Hypholoma sublateritium (strain FD-334 SS-4) TaxID=945553 RepID=A0A0D2PZR5_HYPSF|nr:hypothetical protein HYPSUDRAFT_200106 [Hypholoma sublateritium FD-334 SS-4]
MPTEALISLANQSVNNTVGAIILGGVGASILFGITTLQAYWYYHAYPSDSRLHKCAVAILWILDVLHLALVVQAVYVYTVEGFADVSRLSQVILSVKLEVTVNVIVVLMVHSLYASRVWLLGGYHHGALRYIVGFVVLAGSAAGTLLAARVYSVHTFTEFEHISWTLNVALATSTTIDFIIAIAMCYYLSKSKGSITRLNSRISTIIQFTLSSGLVTAACSLATMFSYILLPDTFIFLALSFLLTQLYVGSFVSMLNSRERKSPRSPGLEEYTASLPSWQPPIKLYPASSSWSPQSAESMATPTSPQEPPNLSPLRTSFHAI